MQNNILLMLSVLVHRASCDQSSTINTLNTVRDVCIYAAIGLSIISAIISLSVYFYLKKLKQQLKRVHNVIDRQSIQLDDFQNNKKLIVRALSSSRNGESFSRQHNNISETIRIQFLQSKTKQPFLTKLKMEGQDSLGRWDAEGYILCRAGQMYFWMLKQYKKESCQNNDREDLKKVLYNSTRFDTNTRKMSGDWFYFEYGTVPEHKGIWTLRIQPNQTLPTEKNLLMKDGLNPEAQNFQKY